MQKCGTEEQEERCDMKPITTDEFRWFCGKLKGVFPNIEFVGGRQSGAAVEITAVIKKPLPVVPTTENKEISTHALTWSATRIERMF